MPTSTENPGDTTLSSQLGPSRSHRWLPNFRLLGTQVGNLPLVSLPPVIIIAALLKSICRHVNGRSCIELVVVTPQPRSGVLVLVIWTHNGRNPSRNCRNHALDHRVPQLFLLALTPLTHWTPSVPWHSPQCCRYAQSSSPSTSLIILELFTLQSCELESMQRQEILW